MTAGRRRCGAEEVEEEEEEEEEDVSSDRIYSLGDGYRAPISSILLEGLTYWRYPPPISEFRVVITTSEGNFPTKTPKHMPDYAMRSTVVLMGPNGSSSLSLWHTVHAYATSLGAVFCPVALSKVHISRPSEESRFTISTVLALLPISSVILLCILLDKSICYVILVSFPLEDQTGSDYHQLLSADLIAPL